MKYSFSVFLCLALFSSSILENVSKKGETSFAPLKDFELCEIICSGKNLPCLEVLERTTYDGKTEKEKVLSTKIIPVCLEYPNESNPT